MTVTHPIKGVQVDYSLTGTGWSACKISVQGLEPVTLTASYVTDALKSLLKGTHKVVSRKATEGWVWFAEEPGQYIIHLTVLHGPGGSGAASVGGGDLPMRLHASATPDGGNWDEIEKEASIVELDAVVGLKAFGQAVSKTAHALLDKHGMEGYKEEWAAHDFPLADLQALDAALGNLQGAGLPQ